MKIWIKLLVGTILGVIAGFFIPDSVGGIMQSISGFVTGVGRYVIFPLVFFSLGIGTSELRQERRIVRVYLSVFKYLALSALLLILIGTASVLVFPPERIPIPIKSGAAYGMIDVMAGLTSIFPRNLFTVFFASGDFLLPLVVLAFLLGLNLDFDRQATRPIVQIFDSLSRIFYHMNSLVVELFAIAMIAIAAAMTMRIAHAGLVMYKQILIILAADTAIVTLGVYPACLYFMGVKANPYRWLYAALGPAIAGLVTGDQYIALSMLSKHGKESFGVPRMIGSAVYPLFASIGRAGTAMISAVSFIFILRCYSSLEITVLQVLWVMLFSFLTSFILGAVPGMGAYFMIAALCGIFGQGRQEGYLILENIAPLLVSFGVFIDVITSAFTSLLIAREENLWTEVEMENFV